MSYDAQKSIDDARRRLTAADRDKAEQQAAQQAQEREADALGTQRLLEFISSMQQLGVQPGPAHNIRKRTSYINLMTKPKTKTLEDRAWGSGWFAEDLFVTTDAKLYLRHYSRGIVSSKNRFGFEVRSQDEETSWTLLPNNTTVYGERRLYDPGYEPTVVLIVAESLNKAVAAEVERQAERLGPL